MSGAIIVEDPEGSLPPEVEPMKEVVMVLQETNIESGEEGTAGFALSQRTGCDGSSRLPVHKLYQDTDEVSQVAYTVAADISLLVCTCLLQRRGHVLVVSGYAVVRANIAGEVDKGFEKEVSPSSWTPNGTCSLLCASGPRVSQS